jgi:hypothetical protein
MRPGRSNSLLATSSFLFLASSPAFTSEGEAWAAVSDSAAMVRLEENIREWKKWHEKPEETQYLTEQEYLELCTPDDSHISRRPSAKCQPWPELERQQFQSSRQAPHLVETGVCNETEVAQPVFYKYRAPGRSWLEEKNDILAGECAILRHATIREGYIVVGTSLDGQTVYEQRRVDEYHYLAIVRDSERRVFAIQERPIEALRSRLRSPSVED